VAVLRHLRSQGPAAEWPGQLPISAEYYTLKSTQVASGGAGISSTLSALRKNRSASVSLKGEESGRSGAGNSNAKARQQPFGRPEEQAGRTAALQLSEGPALYGPAPRSARSRRVSAAFWQSSADAGVAEAADVSLSEANLVPSELRRDERRGRREGALLPLVFGVPEDESSGWDQSYLPHALDTEFSCLTQHKINKKANNPCPEASTRNCVWICRFRCLWPNSPFHHPGNRSNPAPPSPHMSASHPAATNSQGHARKPRARKGRVS